MRPTDYESVALPTELHQQTIADYKCLIKAGQLYQAWLLSSRVVQHGLMRSNKMVAAHVVPHESDAAFNSIGLINGIRYEPGMFSYRNGINMLD